MSNRGPEDRQTGAMSSTRERALITMIRREAAAGVPSAGCLDEAGLAAVVEGTVDTAARPAVVAHLADCARCRRLVASVARALDAAEIASATRRSGWGVRRAAWLLVPAAAAAFLLLVVRPSGPREDGSRHRGRSDDTAAVPLAPIGPVAEPRLLRWSAVPGADRYRVTVFDDSARVTFTRELTDTALRIDDSVPIAAGHRYLWKVEARLGIDRWSASRVVEFSTAQPVP